MKVTGNLEKWASAVLGMVSLILIIKLVWPYTESRMGVAGPTSPASHPPATRRLQTAPRRSAGEPAANDPLVQSGLLKTLQNRPLPELGRNPFEFKTAPAVAPAAQPAAAPAAAPPPAPPPVTLKPMGYNEKPGGVREAFVSDDEQVYVVHEGESFAKKFRVLKITPTEMEIEDESLHQTIRLPFSQ